MEKRCYTCGTYESYDEPLYEYGGEIYCADCLLGQLEGAGLIEIYNVKNYVGDGGRYLGSADDKWGLIEEVCDYYGIEKSRE